MTRLLNLALLAVFLLVLLVPAIAFLFGSESEEDLSSAPTPFPTTISLVRPAPEARGDFARAVFDRSTAKYDAISLRNSISYRVLGSIETDEVISGEDGWLFYKPEFQRWSCARRAALNDELARAEIILGVADAARANVTFVSAPNKASIEGRRLSGRSGRYAPCYFDFESRFRASLSRFPHSVVDHAAALEALNPDEQHYFRQDTHWTLATGYAAIAQLHDARPNVFPAALLPIASEESRMRRTDLGNIMLRLRAEEPYAHPIFSAAASAETGRGVLIIHDSFYGVLRDQLQALFPAATLVSLNAGPPPDYEALSGFEHIVVQSVERSFLIRLNLAWTGPESISVGWGSPMGDHILDQAAEAAEQCNWAEAVNILESPDAQARPLGIEFTSPTRVSATADPRIMFRLPESDAGTVCFEAEFSHATETRTQLYFERDTADETTSIFAEPQSIFRTVPPGRSRFALILPASALGRWARFDPVQRGDFELHSMRIAPGPAGGPRHTTTNAP